ncbi:DUF2750 domain-containing protein [Chryseobacterium gambrini]|uniref:DUF2750 domain-containing protein n=1 Tax=Chryseobacterium gambrini TaxID=373672 RepID=A0AAJ1R7B2_9FLAO|nr:MULTISPECIES: DUF2750 domain-containing protein [Chryseobacterium]MDN4014999.1 DUF2750 domain-containing protein [Chryseobacterium gambrini]QWA37283.1 DUF2750 domain-containing protein [Chryseobacterium sp. ZHDP1]
MHLKEKENILKLEPLERYKYFIKKVADWEFFFTLVNDNGDFVVSELENEKLLPLWSAKEYAELCKINGWEEFTIKELNLDDLENEVIDFIVDNNCLINVFPVYENTGFVVNLQEFTRDLSEELKNYS